MMWERSMKDNLQIIQFNLQVQDTASMDPKEIAESVIVLGGNAVVLNIGGIYAWYNSKVPFHHINEYLPPDRELLRKIIQEFSQSISRSKISAQKSCKI